MASKIAKFFVYLAALLTFGSLLGILVYIFWNGLPALSLDMFSFTYTTENVSMMPAIVTTLYMIGLALLIAVPVGVFTGFYLVEYSNRTSPVVKAISMATDTLAAVPSIVYGLFGFLFFVTFLGFQFSLISGTATITIMILPLIIRSTEEALIAVPMNVREGSYALGAGKIRTIVTVVLPIAMPGILSGIILAIGRIVGESAALIYTLGSATNIPRGLFQSGRTLAVHMYILSSEGLHVDAAFATAVVLVIIVLILNAFSTLVSRQLSKGGK